MSVINKPDFKIFARDAKSGEVETFPDVLRGWGVTQERTAGKPPMEWFNSLGKRSDEWLLYLTQRGLPEWDASVDYPKDALIQHASVYYVALKVSKGEQPNNSQASWKKMSDFLGVDGKLAKDQNGADIPNKPKFIENLGLGEAAKSGLEQTTGTSKTNVMSQDGVTKALKDYLKLTGGTLTGPLVITQDGPAFVIHPATENGSCYIQARDHDNQAVWYIGRPTDGGTAIYFRNYLTDTEISLHQAGVNIKGRLSLSDYSSFDVRYSKIRTVLKSDNGYEKDENTGLIRQWGRTTPFAPGNGYPAKFPIPFPTKCLGVGMLLIRSSATTTTSNESIYCGEPGLSGVQLYHGGGETYPAYWEAWGY